jgi:hypothetical protein
LFSFDLFSGISSSVGNLFLRLKIFQIFILKSFLQIYSM